jgi:uncharacterized protein (TIGR03435 family)
MRVAHVLAAGFLFTGVVLGQSPEPTQPSLAFDVTSVRPLESAERGGIGPPVNGIVRARGVEVRRLIQYAYGLDPQRHDPVPEGGPSWIDRDLFEVIGQGPPDLTFPNARRMMLTLLRERFALRTHVERRELPIYALVVARTDGRLGPGLRPSTVDCSAYSETLLRTGRLAAAREISTTCELLSGGGIGGGRLQLRGTGTIRDMLRSLARSPDVDRPIVDRTGLTGTFDVDFVWAPARTGPAAAAAVDVVSIFTAAQEQLGLKLEAQREQLDVVVIGSVQRPTPN